MRTCANRANSYHFIFLNILEDISPSVGDTDTPVTSALCFKARMDPLACVLHHLSAMDSPESSLV